MKKKLTIEHAPSRRSFAREHYTAETSELSNEGKFLLKLSAESLDKFARCSVCRYVSEGSAVNVGACWTLTWLIKKIGRDVLKCESSANLNTQARMWWCSCEYVKVGGGVG